jgi:hypothetical protein
VEREFDAERPIRWPEPLDGVGTDLAFLLHAPEQPQIVELRQYNGIKSDGVPPPDADPLRYSCSTASVGTAADDQCVMSATEEGWELVFPVDRDLGGYLALYAYWFERRPETEAGGRGYEAAWVFSG